MSANHIASSSFAPVVLAPTYNNATTLADVLERIGRLGLPTIVVDDGATDQTAAILGRFPWLSVVRHPRNRGKAAALQTGFAAAAARGFTHVLTIDTDGQHDPEQIPKLLELSRRSPDALVLGTRRLRTSRYPLKNRLGRRVSNLVVWLESGLRLSDSQCGMRVYPLTWINSIDCVSSRYGYETEILTRGAWAGHCVLQTRVNCRYFPAGQSVSHFRPVTDSLRSLAMHARLLPQSARRWKSALHLRGRWRARTATPRARTQFAGGLAVGIFIACLPLYGVQGLLSFVAARRLKFSGLSAVAGSQISTPPLGAILIFASVAIGDWLLHRRWPDATAWRAAHATFMPLVILRRFLLEWILGGAVVGAVLAALAFVIARLMLGLSGGGNRNGT
jgi:uncharacterized protein (DUF2062 family)